MRTSPRNISNLVELGDLGGAVGGAVGDLVRASFFSLSLSDCWDCGVSSVGASDVQRRLRQRHVWKRVGDAPRLHRAERGDDTVLQRWPYASVFTC